MIEQPFAPVAEHAQNDERVARARVDLLYTQSYPGFVATIINAYVTGIVLWPISDISLLIGWLGYMTVVTMLRYLLVWRRGHSEIRDKTYVAWSNRYAVGAALTGLGWGVGAIVLFPDNDVVYQMFLLVVLAGMSSGAVPFLSSVPRAMLAYLLSALFPVGLWLLTRDDLPHAYVGVMALILLWVLILTGRRMFENLTESLRLRYENEHLVTTLQASGEELQSSNDRLLREVEIRNRAELKLQESNAFLEQVMDTATNAIFVLDMSGRLMRFNNALLSATEYASSELIGRAFVTMVKPEFQSGVVEQFRRAAIEGETVKQHEAECDCRTGAQRTFQISFAPLREEGQISMVVGTAEDITERKALDRIKEEFISTVSHELRTPLTSIRGALGLLRGNVVGELPAQAANLVEIADKNCHRLLKLIDQVLDIQRLEMPQVTFELARLDVTELIRVSIESNDAYAREFDVRYVYSPPEQALYAQVDRDRFIQVMTNLLSNAAKFSPSGGQVDVAVSGDAERLFVHVSDSGPGIPAEFHARVFERFAQADASPSRARGGTGLGLSIAKSFVEKMHGRIWFETRTGGGTIFSVELPLA